MALVLRWLFFFFIIFLESPKENQKEVVNEEEIDFLFLEVSRFMIFPARVSSSCYSSNYWPLLYET